MEFLRSFLRRPFAGKPVVVSRIVGCFHGGKRRGGGGVRRDSILIKLKDYKNQKSATASVSSVLITFKFELKIMWGFYAVVDYCPIKLNDLEINACSVYIANLLAP